MVKRVWFIAFLFNVTAVATWTTARADAPPLPPLDHSRLAPDDPYWHSPDARAEHFRVLDELWKTKLGQLYLGYLTDPLPTIELAGRASLIIQNMSQSADKLGTRVRAIHLLTLDLYARDRITSELERRVRIFERILEQRKTQGEEDTNGGMIRQALFVVAATLPMGSPLVQAEARQIYKYFAARTWRRKCDPLCRDNWHRLFQPREIVRGYRMERFLLAALSVHGATSAAYFAWYKWLPGFFKDYESDHEMLSGQDELLDKADF